ncbi:uncharacterized protein LOC111534463, partial [Piliocolobus tephrosceles]|uniref:uncharacterized protein LOC111534463 n=1 Tax=Piliocolobus tephrosceles TaxID=591936 RepID=UPI001301768B
MRNTNNVSSAGLQLHDPQLETPTPALPQSLAPRSSIRNTNNSSSACLQLHDPQPETPTTAPPRVSRSTIHKLENNAPPCISSSTTLKQKNTNSGYSAFSNLQLHNTQTATTSAPSRVSSCTTLKLEQLLPGSSAPRPSNYKDNVSSL